MMYDIVFLGGGPAGYEGAIAAAKKGLKTAVIEDDLLGGTCLQRGCVPTKALLNSVKIIKQIKGAKKHGILVPDFTLNIEALAKQKNRVVAKLTKGIEHLFNQNGVTLERGLGQITGSNTLVVNGDKTVESKHIVICTGSRPAELPFLKVDGKIIINSDQALNLEDIPDKLLVVGAGAIGLEMGLIYHYLGSSVTVVEILDRVVPGSDSEAAEVLKTELKKQGLKIYTATAISDPVMDDTERAISLTFKNKDKEWQEGFSKVLLAVGRKPYTDGAYSEGLGIEKTSRGFIVVNQNLQTNNPAIYACGDVVEGPLLAHRASHQAESVVTHIHEGGAIHHSPVPGAVFTFPEYASIGISEDHAKEQGIKYKVGKFPYAAGSRSNAIEEKAGFVKVIADVDDRLLGAHIVGAEAGELMPILTYGITQRLTAGDFQEMVFIHPTLSENVREAIGEISGFSIHI